MAIFLRIKAAFVFASAWLRAVALELNRALTEPQRSEADLFARDREDSVFQPQTTARRRPGR